MGEEAEDVVVVVCRCAAADCLYNRENTCANPDGISINEDFECDDFIENPSDEEETEPDH